jgi:DNA-binding transcriptional ArsR family regulator
MGSTTAPTTEPRSEVDDLSEDDVFEMLSNRRRRFVIHALKRAEEPVDVSELSTHVTAWERGVDPDAVKYEDRRNVYSTLQRIHLPKLEEKNVVRVDEEANLVEPTPTLDDLDVYIEVLRGREIPWSLYYFGLAVLAGLVLVGVSVGVPGLAAIDGTTAAVFVVTAFTVSALLHYHYGERARLGNLEEPPELRGRT